IFVRNMTAGVTEVISVSSAGTFGDANSRSPSLSDDGNFVAFHSSSGNLTADTDLPGSDIFLKNRADESVVRVSQTDAGEAGTAGGAGASSTFPAVNANGTAVAFLSKATNFAPATESTAPARDHMHISKPPRVVP